MDPRCPTVLRQHSHRDLHHRTDDDRSSRDFVSALLDHLFGIQNRAGCSCAGPYGHRLLGIDLEKSVRFRALVHRGLNGIKPGWARISLPWYASEEDLDFILSAVEFVASHGMEFVPLYRLGWRDGVWRHLERPEAGRTPLELSLEGLRAERAKPGAGDPEASITEEELHAERECYRAEARELTSRLHERWRNSPATWNPPTGDAELDALVWFRYVHADAPEDEL